MRVVVTGSAGHLGEALVRTLRARGREVVGIDRLESPFTDRVGSVADGDFVRSALAGAGAVIHAAGLHKPHVATHPPGAFIDTNVTGTLNVLEAALEHGVSAVVFTSTTSAFGAALRPAAGEPAAWITEAVQPVPKNIYGVSKIAAEDLCELYHRTRGLNCVVLRISRFFPEDDDDREQRRAFGGVNLKLNELLYRRLDLDDGVEAHLLAAERAPEIGFGRYILSATTPFGPEHLSRLRTDAPAVVRELIPEYEAEYARRGWKMLPGIDRVYVNRRARDDLGWRPRFDFRHAIERLREGRDPFSALAAAVGKKRYHAQAFDGDGPYPVEER